MTPPVFLLEPDELAAAAVGSVLRVSGPEGRHAVTVLRIGPGEVIDAVDGRGRRITARVREVVDRQSMDIDVVSVHDEPPPLVNVTVVQALPKGERGELAVELLTEIGADVIIPWSAANCVAHWRGDRAERSWRRWSDAAHAAAKQSRRARFPVVEPLASTADVLARCAAATALVLQEDATTPIGSVVLPDDGELLLVIGPEGGLSPAELTALVRAGALPVRLGPSVLRTSSAGIAAVSALMAGSSRWAVAPTPTPTVEG